ncbi:MAG: ATP-binding protein [Candidatus Moduliflexus flocculans]|nr:ATP-binding protein [Candidatus Moduliflexus flocculans]MCK7481498.1 ATP-binding protein [Candidatus Moduliflexus flocculans]
MMEDLSLHILDIVENAVAAGAARVLVAVNENAARDVLTIRITDNGRGMSREERARAFDPFFTTGRKRTGLGLPLLSHTAEACGGRVSLETAPGRGTRVVARFRLGHVDRPPLTRMAGTMMALFFGHPEVDLRYTHTRNGHRFSYLRKGRRGDAAAAPAEIASLREALRAGLARIGAG